MPVPLAGLNVPCPSPRKRMEPRLATEDCPPLEKSLQNECGKDEADRFLAAPGLLYPSTPARAPWRWQPPKLARLAKVSVTARQKGKPVMVGVPLSTRDDRILAQRLAFALRHPHSEHAVLIDIAAAQVLLDRVSHDDTPEGAEDEL